jgi:hypothetical protein
MSKHLKNIEDMVGKTVKSGVFIECYESVGIAFTDMSYMFLKIEFWGSESYQFAVKQAVYDAELLDLGIISEEEYLKRLKASDLEFKEKKVERELAELKRLEALYNSHDMGDK